jgi:hypothetical protein
VDVEDELAVVRREEQVLAPPPCAGEPAALERVERRVERLQRGDVGGPGARDRRGADGSVERPAERLDFGVLGNRLSSWTRSA